MLTVDVLIKVYSSQILPHRENLSFLCVREIAGVFDLKFEDDIRERNIFKDP